MTLSALPSTGEGAVYFEVHSPGVYRDLFGTLHAFDPLDQQMPLSLSLPAKVGGRVARRSSHLVCVAPGLLRPQRHQPVPQARDADCTVELGAAALHQALGDQEDPTLWPPCSAELTAVCTCSEAPSTTALLAMLSRRDKRASPPPPPPPPAS